MDPCTRRYWDFAHAYNRVLIYIEHTLFQKECRQVARDISPFGRVLCLLSLARDHMEPQLKVTASMISSCSQASFNTCQTTEESLP
ncbi:hypothetical protein GH714_003581 [Hevea brasiliensis]|uniref:Uncharacterized protein n=1 Tax=Hevea brasiliensis TaxID=3981 RepID=A0A6A6K7F4_HEVBR|nr:hypothetical protein GH714_003581 [Hevea brasiliensis]